MSDSCDPMDCSPPGSCPWDSPGKNAGVGCHFLVQGSSRPRSWTGVSWIACRFFTDWTTEGSCPFHMCLGENIKSGIQKEINTKDFWEISLWEYSLLPILWLCFCIYDTQLNLFKHCLNRFSSALKNLHG